MVVWCASLVGGLDLINHVIEQAGGLRQTSLHTFALTGDGCADHIIGQAHGCSPESRDLQCLESSFSHGCFPFCSYHRASGGRMENDSASLACGLEFVDQILDHGDSCIKARMIVRIVIKCILHFDPADRNQKG